MMAIFYKTTSGLPTVEPGNIVTRWGRGCMGTTGEMLEPAVRMVLGNYFGAMDGQPSPLQVLSATTTVWLPGTPPESVFNYLCNGQRRGEWDAFVCAGAVQELSSVATCPHLHGNAVSVLCPNVSMPACSSFCLSPRWFKKKLLIINKYSFCGILYTACRWPMQLTTPCCSCNRQASMSRAR